MILVLSVYVTNDRSYNSYSRDEIFKYMLESYKNIPFDEIYLFILIDPKLLQPNHYFYHNDLTEFLYNNFNRLPKEKIHITHNRYATQNEWIPFMQMLMDKYGPNESIWFTQNDDHIFVDYNNDILIEGLEILKNEQNHHKSIYFSHWPELIKLSGKYENPQMIGNYIKFHLSLLDSIQIFNLKYLYDIMVNYKWLHNHIRIDSLLNELTSKPSEDNVLEQVILVPLREMVRHFDGYDHAGMDRNACSPLILPTNTFYYTPDNLHRKMTASHSSFWTKNNNFIIPHEWIHKNILLHDVHAHTV